jgi:hypothetical protein
VAANCRRVCTNKMVFASARESFSLSLMASSPYKMSSSPGSSSTYSSNRSPAAVDISKDAKDLYGLESYYTHSTDLFRDNATVASTKTAGTNYTASTRKSRRPGQAKVRLQQQELGERSRITRRSGGSPQRQPQQRGWQETMKQAAAESNNTWDPRHGWAKYVMEPNDVRSQLTPEVLSPPRPNRSNSERTRTQAPLMIDVEGEDEKINIFDDLRDTGPLYEI